MPRFWLSGPRLFNGLVRPGISFSGRELAVWRKKAPKVSEDATLGICRRPDGAMILAGIVTSRRACRSATSAVTINDDQDQL